MANKKNGSVADVVTALAIPLAEQLGYSIWDVEYVREGADYYLRITIDSPDGITIDDCEKMHRAIDPVLDEADPIENAYYLEVSSPGIERELRTDEHILACLGETVEVKLYAPLNGVKSFVGELFGYEDGRVSVKNGEKVNSFERKEIAHIKTVFDFGD